jgi:hypothetical protein
MGKRQACLDIINEYEFSHGMADHVYMHLACSSYLNLNLNVQALVLASPPILQWFVPANPEPLMLASAFSTVAPKLQLAWCMSFLATDSWLNFIVL